MKKIRGALKRFGTLVGILMALASWCRASEISGPEQVPAGCLAVFNTENAAVWEVVPETYASAVYVDRDGKSLVFASPEEAVVTVVAAWVTETKPVLAVKTFYNGRQQPPPEPIPIPGTFAERIRQEAKKVTGESAQVDIQSIVTSIESVVKGIDARTIRTPAGARAAFRQQWQRRAIAISPQSVSRWSPFFDAVSEALADGDLTQLRDNFREMAEVLSTMKNGG